MSSAVLTISAHTAAGGGLPDPATTIALTGLLGWLATAISDRVSGTTGILATLSVAQLLLHSALTLISGHHGAPAFDPGLMTMSHAVATLLIALLLSHTERGLLLVAASLRRLLPVVFTPAPPPHGTPGVVLCSPVPDDYVRVLLRRVCTRRGPPAYS
ncbi:hypothetical protein [Haloechinothrix halophila]|uniref:hypothetical protein n=1 Tax=Haloechinothrix halophila TaxID=1069073 RepID=UPI001E5210B8|nr:hypothetical protein [Haloechinothrix halophila]